MNLLRIYIAFTCVLLIAAVSLDDYCKIDKKNTPCSTKCIRAKRCGHTGTEFRLLTDEEREIILDKHNELREAVAKGDYSGNHVPSCAGGIKALTYDKEVEFLASCHIKACEFEHDTRRLTLSRGPAGQNLFMTSAGSNVGFGKNFLTEGTLAWFSEYKKLSEGDAKGFSNFPTVEGTWHLTALLWGDTQYLGCAKMHYVHKKYHNYALFCDYLPVSNIVGAPVYEAGECTANDRYPTLCGSIRPIADDSYVPPINLNHGRVLKSLPVVYYFGIVVIVAVGDILQNFC